MSNLIESTTPLSPRLEVSDGETFTNDSLKSAGAEFKDSDVGLEVIAENPGSGEIEEGSDLIKGLTTTANLVVGTVVTGEGIPAETTITELVAPGEVKLSAEATETKITTLTFTGPLNITPGTTITKVESDELVKLSVPTNANAEELSFALARETFTSDTFLVPRAVAVTGSIAITWEEGEGMYACVYVDQSGDGINWDLTSSQKVEPDGEGDPIEVELYDQYFRVRVVNNGEVPQTVLRLFVNARDIYGAFITKQEPPTPGGAWISLFYNPSTERYQVVDRFEAADGFLANGEAAIHNKRNGKYASFPVNAATVTHETIEPTTEHLTEPF